MVKSPIAIDGIDDIVDHVRKKFSVKPKVAFAGFGNAGKSSLLNAIYGSSVVRVSMKTDQTMGPETAERFGIDFTDTPGIGTSKFSLENVLDMGIFDQQHVVIHVLNGTSAISREDERLHAALDASLARSITVVNKIDLLEPEEQAQFLESVREKLGLEPPAVLLVSAKRGTGVRGLVGRIAELLPAAMQDAFIGQQHADEELKEKRIRALIYSKAAVAAGVAFVPIPIADILVLTPIQIAMVTAIGYLHGIEVTGERAAELMGVVGAGIGFREAARQIVKLIPGYGSAISASIAFAGTVALGEAAHLWFKRNMRVDVSDLRTLFQRTAEKAKEEYSLERPQPGELSREVVELRRRLAAGELTEAEFAIALASLEARHDITKAN
jgi:small GTP-binding protein